ncbi:cardiolipin synthase [Paenibacillus baekrokdamisoli]|uniref:Cardiolipin synthase n=1 Tax=Paenibacillus baekrokdamisoli TaxID=1712516 RepID=A0A3G9ITV1_9BACL|nr:cardiolipin synthase [Paenibacillus baekrokdamisoli]MBB3071675.1 cardiolipin synthase [Paenibacillus baekrokdamisoli]BBH21816.1 cardiolipin synthase [Paenibacillus baekrokdamisoli]
MIWVVLALIIFIFQIATILILEFRHPSKTVAWLLILFIFPIIGFVMYYFLAQEYQRRRTVRKRGVVAEEMRLQALLRCKIVHRPGDMHSNQFTHQERLFRMLQSMTLSPITSCNEASVLTNADETYASILEAIEQAKHHIHVEYYTIRHDQIGQRFKEALIKKAKEGLEVRVIYDGVGSLELSNRYLEELAAAGIHTQCFLAPRLAFFDKRMNYRNHRKIVVVDGLVGFVGGINIGDEYLGANPKLGFWRDTHMRIKGDAVYFLQEVFMQDWFFTSKERLNNLAYLPEHSCVSNEQVQIVSSGPNSSADAILECVFAAISVAKSRIFIETPYFIPDPSVLMGLRTAALSGVDVRIIIPYVADSKLVLYASLSYVEDLLMAGVRFYRYRKGFIHAKVLIVDELIASVGSANMDMRSFFSNFEINALMFDESAIKQLDDDFKKDLEDCMEIHMYEFKRRPRWQKASEVIARMLSPLL